MNRDVLIAGVGMTPFVKPTASPSYLQMGAAAARAALQDAGLGYRDLGFAAVGYVYGDSTCGQAALYELGRTGVPIVNVNNNCATGSSALYIARQWILSGAVECALALGFEQMQTGALKTHWDDRPSPFHEFDKLRDELLPAPDIPLALRYFGGAGKEYMDRHHVGPGLFAAIRAKASRHARHNPNALLRQEVSEAEVLAAPLVYPEASMTRLMACPPTCGAAAAVLVSENFLRSRGGRPRVQIAAQTLATDPESTFDSRSLISLVGYDMARLAADRLYEAAGIGPNEVDVVELHDCFAQNEVLAYEALRLCPEGGAEKFVRQGDNTYGGRCVTNPSGGLLSKGHPLGATGLAQCAELVWQLRGEAQLRQVSNARVGLQHNLGLGGACVTTLYRAL